MAALGQALAAAARRGVVDVAHHGWARVRQDQDGRLWEEMPERWWDVIAAKEETSV